MKRERKPPKTWRRNMITSAALLLLLDAGILSETPDLVRIEFALAVTLVVGGFILAVWRSNTRLERAASERESGGSSSK